MKSKIKICGLKTIEDIQLINQYSVSYAGFIFAKKSPRYINVEQAIRMRQLLREGIKAVGVFVDTEIEQVNQIAQLVGLDILQLHSNETDRDCKRACKPVWKAIRVKDSVSVEEAKNYPSAEGILFDTYSALEHGGTGKSFLWDQVKDFSKERFTILAGGLKADTILMAQQIVRPHVLDINSSLETDGKKDRYKIEELMRRVENEI